MRGEVKLGEICPVEDFVPRDGKGLEGDQRELISMHEGKLTTSCLTMTGWVVCSGECDSQLVVTRGDGDLALPLHVSGAVLGSSTSNDALRSLNAVERILTSWLVWSTSNTMSERSLLKRLALRRAGRGSLT